MKATRFGRRALASEAGLVRSRPRAAAARGPTRAEHRNCDRPAQGISEHLDRGRSPADRRTDAGSPSWCEGGRHCCIVNTLLPTRVRAVDDRRVPVAHVRAPTVEGFPGSTKSTIHDPMESQ